MVDAMGLIQMVRRSWSMIHTGTCIHGPVVVVVVVVVMVVVVVVMVVGSMMRRMIIIGSHAFAMRL